MADGRTVTVKVRLDMEDLNADIEEAKHRLMEVGALSEAVAQSLIDSALEFFPKISLPRLAYTLVP